MTYDPPEIDIPSPGLPWSRLLYSVRVGATTTRLKFPDRESPVTLGPMDEALLRILIDRLREHHYDHPVMHALSRALAIHTEEVETIIRRQSEEDHTHEADPVS